MSRIIDRSGQKFNKWTFMSLVGVNKYKESLWKCRCECGFEKIQVAGNITSGGSKQCENCSNKYKNYLEEFSDTMWNLIVSRANKKNFELSITKQEAYQIFLNQNKKCKLSGIDIKFAISSKDYLSKNQTASLDRIDSSIGYTKNNVQWVHKNINLMKGCLSDQEFIHFCNLVSKHNKNTN